jgi:IS605 OrfB family transposase
MPRRRDLTASRVVYRTARVGLRLTRAQRRRLLGLLVSAGDVWACVLEVNAWRARRDRPLAGYQELCRELTASGPGTFGELDVTGGRSVLRRYSDAWFAAAKRRKAGDAAARFPRRRRRMVPVRWYAGTFGLDGRRLRVPVARGCPPLAVRLDRDLPYPADQIRSVTLLYDAGRLWADVTAEIRVVQYPDGEGPDRSRVAGVDLGIIHPYALAAPDGQALLVSGRAVRAECRQHLRDARARRRAVARRAPRPGQQGSRRWRQHRRRQRAVEARHRRRVRQAQHEAAKTVITWAVEHRIGTLAVGDPRGVLALKAGRRHNGRTRAWRVGHLLRALRDKAEAAGVKFVLVDERGTSSTCPRCARRIPRPPEGSCPARTAGSPGTATCSRPPASPPARVAASRRLTARPTSRTAAPGHTCQACRQHDVTPAAAPITAAPEGPWPAPARPAQPVPGPGGESLAPRRGARKHATVVTCWSTSSGMPPGPLAPRPPGRSPCQAAAARSG